MDRRGVPSGGFDLCHPQAVLAYEEGRVVSHKAVRKWLLSWGTAEERPRPKVGD